MKNKLLSALLTIGFLFCIPIALIEPGWFLAYKQLKQDLKPSQNKDIEEHQFIAEEWMAD